MNREQLLARLREIQAKTQNIRNHAAGRDFTSSEMDELDELVEESKKLRRQLATLDSVTELDTFEDTSPAPRVAAPTPAVAPRPEAPSPTRQAAVQDDLDQVGFVPNIRPYQGTRAYFGRAHDPIGLSGGGYELRGSGNATEMRLPQERDPRWCWRSLGEYAQAVASACVPGAREVDRRLTWNQPTDYGNTLVPEEGGYAVPPDFREQIAQLVGGEGSFLPMTDEYSTFSNAITIPKDETTVWGSSGVQAYWVAEGSKITESKPDLLEQVVPLHKLAALVPMTQELLEDAAATDSWLRRRTPEVMNWEINDALYNGNGTGKPLGVLASPARIEVAPAVPAQDGTLEYEDIVNMFSRMHASYLLSAVWMISQDLMPRVLELARIFKNVAGNENVGGESMFVPPGRLSDAPFGSILGRPIIYSDVCQAAGTVGDISFVDWRRYMSITKRAGIRFDLSIHLYFDYDISTYRWIYRVGGKNWLDNPITPAYGTATRSNIITLGARAAP